jgi:hypothetical protein
MVTLIRPSQLRRLGRSMLRKGPTSKYAVESS